MAQATGSTAGKKTRRLSSSSLEAPKRRSGKTSRKPSNIGKTSKKGISPSFPIEEFLDRRLADPEEAIGYLNTCCMPLRGFSETGIIRMVFRFSN
jgi:hypothetical protein